MSNFITYENQTLYDLSIGLICQVDVQKDAMAGRARDAQQHADLPFFDAEQALTTIEFMPRYFNHGRNFTPLALGISRLAPEGPMAYAPLLGGGLPDLSQEKKKTKTCAACTAAHVAPPQQRKHVPPAPPRMLPKYKRRGNVAERADSCLPVCPVLLRRFCHLAKSSHRASRTLRASSTAALD